jgi:hypothetical protein
MGSVERISRTARPAPSKDGVDLARGREDAPAIPRGGLPMRYKVGAEQLQQVPTLLHRPDTAFRASRVAPAGPTHVVSTRTGEPPAGSRPRGWRCWTKTGNKHSSSRNVLGASPPSWPAPATSRIALVAAHDLLAQARRRSHHRGRDCAGIVARSSGRCLSAGWPRGAGYLRLHRGPATYR